MDYKIKYNNALEKARELMAKGYYKLMPEIFPELKKEVKSCENCICGHWTMFDNEYGRYPVVLCYLHKDCGGDEAFPIQEDEWIECAESCKEYEKDKRL